MKNSKHANMKEFGFDTATEVWRFAFAYDPTRHAVVLYGGGKQGTNEKLLYQKLIAKADRRFDGWLKTLAKAGSGVRRRSREEKRKGTERRQEMKKEAKAMGQRRTGDKSAVTPRADKDWDVLSALPAARLSELLGPTIDEVMAQDFDAETIAKIEKSSDRRARHWREAMRAESVALAVLRKMRMSAGLTQKAMAKRLVVSPPAISKMESGDPQFSSVLAYALALGNDLSLTISGKNGKTVVPFTVSKPKLAVRRKQQADRVSR